VVKVLVVDLVYHPGLVQFGELRIPAFVRVDGLLERLHAAFVESLIHFGEHQELARQAQHVAGKQFVAHFLIENARRLYVLYFAHYESVHHRDLHCQCGQQLPYFRAFEFFVVVNSVLCYFDQIIWIQIKVLSGVDNVLRILKPLPRIYLG